MTQENHTPQHDEDNEPPPSLPVYFGGYALVFGGIIALAALLVLVAKLMR